MTTNSSLHRPNFSPEFTAWLATADEIDLKDAYCESYKEAHGIKARWIYSYTYTREQWADSFYSLGLDIKAENAREQEQQARFAAQIESLGLTAWAAANNIRNMYDLWDHNMNNEYTKDEPLTKAEQMAGKVGYEGEL